MDHLPQIAENLALRAADLVITGSQVLIEANEREGMVGSLHIPIEALEAYPTSGWILAVGPKITENLRVGDFVLIEEEGLSLEHSYYDVFEITLRHDDGFVEDIFVPIEVEPVVKEQVEKFRRGGSNSILSVEDKKNGGSISFNCSNVASWQQGQIANPRYNLTYVPVYMAIFLNEEDRPALFYIVDEARILTTVEY